VGGSLGAILAEAPEGAFEHRVSGITGGEGEGVMGKLMGSLVGSVAVLAVAGAMLSEPSLAAGRMQATADPAKTVTQSIRLKVLPDKVAEFEALVAQLVRDIHAHEPGVIAYEVRRVTDDPLTYVYFLSFEDQASFDRYSAADWHTGVSPKIIALLDGSPVFENLESFY
jgi:quinol monooxygenase YgiN